MSLGALMLQDVIFAIEEHAYDVSFERKNVGGSYNSTTRKMSGTTSTETVRGVFIRNMKSLNADGMMVNDENVFLMKATNLSKVPQDGDVLTGGGFSGKIRSAKPVKSGDTVILYICHMDG